MSAGDKVKLCMLCMISRTMGESMRERSVVFCPVVTCGAPLWSASINRDGACVPDKIKQVTPMLLETEESLMKIVSDAENQAVEMARKVFGHLFPKKEDK